MPDTDTTPEVPTLDLRTLTLGELAEIEIASGRSFDQLMRGTAGRWLVALFVSQWRSSGSVPSWRELSDRRPLGNASSSSRSRSGGSREPSRR